MIRAAYQSELVNLDELTSLLGRPQSARTAVCLEASKLGLTNLHRTKRTVLRGAQLPAWKGDAARPNTKRTRARRLYPLGPCEDCGNPATDHHHKDGDTGNNVKSNIAILCRRCHMLEDGRLAKVSKRMTALKGLVRVHPSPCSHCSALAKPLRKGLCAACSVYLYRTGEMRPLNLIEMAVNRKGKHPIDDHHPPAEGDV